MFQSLSPSFNICFSIISTEEPKIETAVHKQAELSSVILVRRYGSDNFMPGFRCIYSLSFSHELRI